MELGYAQAPVDPHEFNDGYIRTFGNIPEFSEDEIQMMTRWLAQGDVSMIAMYLTEHTYKLDSDTAEFIIRELMRGNL